MEGNNRVRVVILAGSFRIKGEIELVPGARITDYMIESKPFIAVTNAEVWDLEGRRIMNVPFLNVRRDHVVVVAPDA
jgi:hypothetical protein